MTVRDARAGDWVIFKSGPRRVVEVYNRGLTFVQLVNGRIGGGGKFKTTHADGERTTTYTWWDLACAGVLGVRPTR